MTERLIWSDVYKSLLNFPGISLWAVNTQVLLNRLLFQKKRTPICILVVWNCGLSLLHSVLFDLSVSWISKYQWNLSLMMSTTPTLFLPPTIPSAFCFPLGRCFGSISLSVPICAGLHPPPLDSKSPQRTVMLSFHKSSTTGPSKVTSVI